MKIIGIDIAIENLAFCGIETETDPLSPTPTIQLKKEEWFVLDTTPEDYKQTCAHEGKRKVCGQKAGWFYVEKETSEHHFYCAAHKKVLIAAATATAAAKGDGSKKKKWQTLNKNFLKTNDVIRSMFAKMDQHRAFWDTADYILIEKQPPKNPKMVAIMNYLYSYFVLRLWADRSADTIRLKDILFVDAKNKNTYCQSVLSASDLAQLQEKYDPVKNKYQFYKKTSILCVQQELQQQQQLDLLTYFNSYKKIDDLADSRNMVLWWLKQPQKVKVKSKSPAKKKNVPVPVAEAEIDE
jgi:hypothetical protein